MLYFFAIDLSRYVILAFLINQYFGKNNPNQIQNTNHLSPSSFFVYNLTINHGISTYNYIF